MASLGQPYSAQASSGKRRSNIERIFPEPDGCRKGTIAMVPDLCMITQSGFTEIRFRPVEVLYQVPPVGEITVIYFFSAEGFIFQKPDGILFRLRPVLLSFRLVNSRKILRLPYKVRRQMENLQDIHVLRKESRISKGKENRGLRQPP